MAQHDYNIANQGFPAFRTDLNNALSAIQTTNSGTSRPTGAVAGQLWLDTTSPTTPTLKYYDGADDISLATIDHSANTVNWLDSTVSITGLTTTATGTVLTLSDSVSTSTVNLIIDNQKEIRFRETTANGTNYVALKAPASVASDLTFTLPATDGTANQVLTTNGSGVLSFATPASGIAWQSSVKTSGFTAVAGEGYFCNTTSSAFTVTLPATPTAGQQVAVVDYAGTFDTNKCIINPNGNKIEGGTSNLQLTGEREGVTLVYIDATQGWLATSGINEGTDALAPVPYSADFLVIAGGGGAGGNGGGNSSAGGGGAGGYRSSNATYGSSGGGGSAESSLTFNVGTVYTITVGAGGAGGAAAVDSNSGVGALGTDSSISGTGISTITSTGGGGGGCSGGSSGGPPTSGGSGGGCNKNKSPVGSGTANQGYAGAKGTVAEASGGGGGASQTPTANSTSDGGNGGNGVASTITGSSVTRGGGGGGGTQTASGGIGGTGGGGNTVTPTAAGSAGTANTGGGGGAGNSVTGTGYIGGAGGKGVVILRMPTANYTGTTTGSPTVSTSGSDTILVYNDSGTYTG
jgi:hypothetical protein